MTDFHAFSKRARTVKALFLLILIGFSANIIFSIGLVFWEISPMSEESTYTVSFTTDQHGNKLTTRIENELFFPYLQITDNIMRPTENFKGTVNQAVIGITLIGTLIKLPLFYVLWIAYSVFKNLSESRTPFTTDLFDRIRHMGKVLILFGLIGNLAFSVLISAFVTGDFYFNNPIELTYIILGLVLYVVSEVMEYGLALQVEVDETL